GEHLEHGTVMAVSVPGLGFDIYGCEFPATGRKWSHRLMWDAVLAQAAASPRPVIIVGDLNTGAHEIDEEGSCICREDFADLPAIGWRDLFREVHGQQLAFSWRSPFGNRFRMDHALARADLDVEIVGVEYVNRLGRRPLWPGVAHPGQKVLSDHAPIMIDVTGVSRPVDTPSGRGWLASLRGFASTCAIDPAVVGDVAERIGRRIDAGEIEQIPTMDLRRCLTALVAGIADDQTIDSHPIDGQLELDLRAIEGEILRRHRRVL
ncbi:MAG: endonuclease/exonuclease/phosphatase family protein, partial [Acidimicrobiia bacterium]